MKVTIQDQFWRLESPSSHRKLAEWDEVVDLESIECPANMMHQRGGKRLTDLSVVLPDGPVEDFVWTWHSECLVQDSTLTFLRKCGVTGFDVKPVTARFKKSSVQPPKLWELILTGWAGMASPQSGIRFDESKSCPACGHLRYTGLLHPERLIEENRWDGSDFFMIWPMPKFVFVTERVVEAIRARELMGVHMVRMSELKPTDGFAPGRLSYWMPEKRARELGEPLGIY